MGQGIISCDGHLVEPLEALPAGASYQGTTKQLLILGEGYDCPPLPVWTSVGCGSPGAGGGFERPLGLDDCPGAFDPAVRASYCGLKGVGAEILYPTFATLAVECAVEPRMAHEAAQQYNIWASKWANSAAFYPLHLCGGRHPDDLFANVYIAHNEDAVGVLFPQQLFMHSWRDCMEVFEAAADHNLPVHWHAFTKPNMQSFQADPLTQAWQGVRPAQDILLELMLGGVFREVPTLKVVFAEMDCGWVPHWKTRLQRLVGKYGKLAGCGVTESDVHDWLYNNVYFAVQDIAEAQELAPHVNTLWGWDYPHADAVSVPTFGSLESRDRQFACMQARALEVYPHLKEVAGGS